MSVGSTFSKRTVKERNYESSPHTVRRMTLVPLREIFKSNNLTAADFITIDVEGFEREVLASNDWDKFKAKVLCIEGRGYGKFLKPFGYRFVLFDGGNSYYRLAGRVA